MVLSCARPSPPPGAARLSAVGAGPLVAATLDIIASLPSFADSATTMSKSFIQSRRPNNQPRQTTCIEFAFNHPSTFIIHFRSRIRPEANYHFTPPTQSTLIPALFSRAFLGPLRGSLDPHLSVIEPAFCPVQTCQFKEAYDRHCASWPSLQNNHHLTLLPYHPRLPNNRAFSHPRHEKIPSCVTSVVVDVFDSALQSSTPTQPRSLTAPSSGLSCASTLLASAWDFGHLVDAKKPARVRHNLEGCIRTRKKRTGILEHG